VIGDLAGAISALIIEVPEAERIVGRWRRVHDPSAALGVPPHVTILYPFIAPHAIDAATLGVVRSIAAAHEPFDAALTAVSSFVDQVVWLAPSPEAPFRTLSSAVWAHFPEHPPYEGRFRDLVPHLTVAEVDSSSVRLLHREVERDLSGRLPLEFRVESLSLFVTRGGRWTVHSRFPLGAGAGGP
jgi:2'-5' RNA ligase